MSIVTWEFESPPLHSAKGNLLKGRFPLRGNSSVGRAQPCQGWGREFESRFPLKEEAVQTDCFFLLCKMKTRTKRPPSPLPGVGGVNIVRDKSLARSASSSLVFRSNEKSNPNGLLFFVLSHCKPYLNEAAHTPLSGAGEGGGR